MQSSQRFRQSFIITSQPSETSGPRKTALHHPSARQQNEPPFGVRQLDHFQPDTLSLGSLRCLLTSVASINVCHLHIVPSRLLYRLRQLRYLGPVSLVGRSYTHGEQMSQRVYSYMHLATLLAFSSVITCACSTLRRRLQRTAIKDNSSRLSIAALSHAQYRLQVVYHRLEDARL